MVEELLDNLEFLLRWQFIPSYRRQRVLHELRREVEAPAGARHVSRLRRWQYLATLATLPAHRAVTIIGHEHRERGAASYARALLLVLIFLPAIIVLAAELAGFAGRGVAALSLALAFANFVLVMWMRKLRLAAERAGPGAS